MNYDVATATETVGKIACRVIAAGVMDVLAVAAIGAFVLVDKVVRHSPLVGRVAPMLFIAWGIYLMLSG